ncbi:MAG: biotin/lipoyl-binding protein [Propionibacteriaceae bacterium]|nr:biotin/lipoyl-binding protein [Propionibacteriaceae bacterium]
MSLLKRRGVVAGVAALLVLGLLVWALWPRTTEAAYVTAPATRGSVAQTLSLVGPVERVGQAEVTYRTPGMVTAVHARLGDDVTAGQPLVSIDPAPLRLSVLQARAQLAQAEAQLDANLAAQRAGEDAPSAGLPTQQPPAAPPGGPPGGPPGPPVTGPPGTPGTPGAPGGPGAPDYLIALNASLANLQEAVAVQQQRCVPVFAIFQQLRDGRDNLPNLPEVPTLPELPDLPEVPEVPETPTPERPPGAYPIPGGPPQPIYPTPTPEPSVTPEPSPEPTASPEPSPDPSASPQPIVSPEPSPTPTASPQPVPDPTPTPTASPTPGPTPGPTPTPDPRLPDLVEFSEEIEACSAAMVALAAAEAETGAAINTAVVGFAEQTQQAQQALARAQAELEAAMAAARTQAEEAGRRAAEEAIRQARADLEAQMAASFGGRVTNATIANDRARLVQARQGVESAEADLAAATATSPITGVVGALDFAVGESSAGRSAIVVGPGAAEVSVEVPLSSRALVAPGVPASVGALAAPASLGGQVASVSVLPEGSGSPTYRTTIVADDPEQSLRSGSWAQATLALARADDVLTVPASAVTKITDTTATVEVVDAALDQTARTVTVVTGRAGGGRVEIVSGLDDGALVVLADRRLPVPGGIDQYAPASRASASPTPAR